MLSHKFLVVSATMLTTLSAAGLSFADDTSRPAAPASGAPATQTAPNGSASTSSVSSTSTTTVATPSTPSVPTTQTTTTTQGVPATPPASDVPASTTTTTAGDPMDAPIPPSSEPQHDSVTVYKTQRPNRPLLITGGAILAGSYVTTAAVVAANSPPEDKDLYIPIAGPWINLANRECVGDCPNETRDVILIAGSGVLQGVGAAMLITSFFVPEKVPAARIQAGPVKMQITPTAARGAGGIGAFGTF